ncbi:hypothetical protein F5Y15DRAFT_218243 [Xylariaceae sp. FL0016]|nr:hypothetical protein F5Y15DRAFT_218243 [Xylariaceae sp. FL0016]
MYPWQNALERLATATNLHVDALGLVTMLGAEEVDRSVGRLVSSRYVDFLPLLGAHVLAGDRFTQKKPGFTLYNLSSGIQTTELAGWFTRWLKSQEFSQVQDIVDWAVEEQRPRRSSAWNVGFLLIGVPLNGMLIALTVLSGDWWGFVNAIAMVVSVAVRLHLVSQCRRGMDNALRIAKTKAEGDYRERQEKYEAQLRLSEKQAHLPSEPAGEDGAASPTDAPIPPRSLLEVAKAIVITEDSKVVTIRAPDYVIANVFTKNPRVPNPRFYMLARAAGWIAFAFHIIALGMAGLFTQIYTVVLIIGATVLSVYKVGCDDWMLSYKAERAPRVDTESQGGVPRCWVSSTLGVHCSRYPTLDGESEPRRQDLFVKLDPNPTELSLMKDWYLIPHKNPHWMLDFQDKRDRYNETKERQRRGTANLG